MQLDLTIDILTIYILNGKKFLCKVKVVYMEDFATYTL